MGTEAGTSRVRMGKTGSMVSAMAGLWGEGGYSGRGPSTDPAMQLAKLNERTKPNHGFQVKLSPCSKGSTNICFIASHSAIRIPMLLFLSLPVAGLHRQCD